MPAPAVADILKEFHAPEGALISLVVSALILGSVFGIVLCRIISVLLVFRFFSGCAGAAPLAVGAGTIADWVLSLGPSQEAFWTSTWVGIGSFGWSASCESILEGRAKKDRKTTRAVLDTDVSPGTVFSEAIKRPFRLLFLHPVVLAFASYLPSYTSTSRAVSPQQFPF
ncbi:MFS multidrug transporter [Colletotrichum tofieldiae]|uniref:MFS multidrug transporter n=1 Tax=Colletotrichum tofieldiae TaxID=708197 RepID=A0A166S8L4_9PEZI|nr:MFS multidrug transporter [Colletotrichum tofieldiae]